MAESSPQPPAPAPRSGIGRLISENLECLAIAVVMALILKFFLIEAFKIPTGSMQPTIMGDRTNGVFDRVLVNKMYYFFREPDRYDVVVFKNPLNRRQNYIKRLVGFGGEQLTIRNGDIFAATREAGVFGTSQIQRKPDSVWRSVRKQLWPTFPEAGRLSDFLEAGERDGEFKKDWVRLMAPEGRSAEVRTKRPIKDGFFDGYDGRLVGHPGRGNEANHVGDVEWAAAIKPKNGTKEVVFEIQEGERIHRAKLPCDSGDTTIVTLDRRAPDRGPIMEKTVPGVWLPHEESTFVSFRNVDDELVLHVDGDEVARIPYITDRVDQELRTRCVIRVEGGAIDVEDLELYRDIYYLPKSSDDAAREADYVIPDDHFFALGDNTQSSSDCRQWEMATYRWREGDEIREESGNLFLEFYTAEMNPDANPRWGPDQDSVLFRNIYGELYDIPVDAIQNKRPREPRKTEYHSVPRELLLGKALAVFWPIPPMSPTWRLKWVR